LRVEQCFSITKTEPTLDQLIVVGNAVGYDDYGKPLDDVVFTYGFTRDLYRQVDIRHITMEKLWRIVKHRNIGELKLEDGE
jgi:hypothetical protein